MDKHAVLKKYFGYDHFSEGQGQLIDQILSGQDVFGIMPTGAGKSICFQVPALMSKGITVVVSPLISLMKDQVMALNQNGIAAAFINSSLTERQQTAAMRNAVNGLYKLIYIAPERLMTRDFLDFAQTADISIVAVDEAHCISQWGQDFRPSYMNIPAFLQALPKRPALGAFTATATSAVQDDVIESLGLISPNVLVTGFDRPNLFYHTAKPVDKYMYLSKFLDDKKDLSGIIYCSTRANVEDICAMLIEDGHAATRYHAGLADIERKENQESFLYDQSRVMVATNAFGMGIDKPNISYVIHYNMPKDIEGYYQEAGRAGRGGQGATCLLMHDAKDMATHNWMIERANFNEQLQPDAKALLTHNSIKRLHKMANYCETTDCLRGFILKYFGEQVKENCNNCINCNRDFEYSDITIDAQKILSCVVRMQGRFGVKLILDTLRGKKSARLKELGLDKLSTYGISNASGSYLTEVLNYMVAHEYLIKTPTTYPTIKPGPKAQVLLQKDAKLQMKTFNITRDLHEKPIKPQKSTQAAKEVNAELMQHLRDIRAKIAKELSVPAFVIFHDSSLIDMCQKMPKTIDEFLEVSGVGQVKAKRYGQDFLQAINKFEVN